MFHLLILSVRGPKRCIPALFKVSLGIFKEYSWNSRKIVIPENCSPEHVKQCLPDF